MKTATGDRLSGNQNQVDRFKQGLSMQPKALPNHAARLVSDGGFADTATGDYS